MFTLNFFIRADDGTLVEVTGIFSVKDRKPEKYLGLSKMAASLFLIFRSLPLSCCVSGNVKHCFHSEADLSFAALSLNEEVEGGRQKCKTNHLGWSHETDASESSPFIKLIYLCLKNLIILCA